MLLYLLFGLVFSLLGLYIEQKRSAKRTFRTIRDWISSNERVLASTILKIVQNEKYHFSEKIIQTGDVVFLIAWEKQSVKIFSLGNNGSNEKIILPQYKILTKKLKNKQTIYTYSFNSISVYHRCAQPIDHYILWIRRQNLSSILGNKNPKLGN